MWNQGDEKGWRSLSADANPPRLRETRGRILVYCGQAKPEKSREGKWFEERKHELSGQFASLL